METLFDTLNGDDEERAGFIKLIPTWIKSTNSALQMLEMLESSMDENEDADRGRLERENIEGERKK